MRIEVVIAALALSVPAAAQQRGSISDVAGSAAAAGGATEFTVSGRNPCGAVNLDYGDGQAITHPIRALPVTISHTYARAGSYQVRARGMGNCDGEASMTVRVIGPGGRGNTGAAVSRFEGMDRNNDGTITRAEWNGSAQSFRVHDWNGDGVLSGDEVRVGARRQWDQDPDYAPTGTTLRDWTERRFQQLDANRDGRILRREWPFTAEEFLRVDRNRDGALTQAEFLDPEANDDRDDQFDYLDLNGNNRVELSEWHASRETFQWLDRNRDGVLSRTEVAGEDLESGDQFATLDLNNDRAISPTEWQWSRTSFDRLDRNNDGRLSRAEYDAAGPDRHDRHLGPDCRQRAGSLDRHRHLRAGRRDDLSRSDRFNHGCPATRTTSPTLRAREADDWPRTHRCRTNPPACCSFASATERRSLPAGVQTASASRKPAGCTWGSTTIIWGTTPASSG